ncbi:MarR family winged helix-turn-helix transcriptional regulator [Mobilicoccus massiliensis]|uniref:MarR family winged helix-turn-helix transcriptional regulator n=1 Tax=Mobilicoccus massiliensis TaxID=1522310 RepID=UPI0005908124|nr:MarR family transcriptional regulator [Mobilicoccus massiliensis]
MNRRAAQETTFWSFVARARERLAQEHGYQDVLATELLLKLNRASGIVTYDLEASVHRPRGRAWSAFRILYVLWLAGPLEAKKAAELAGLSRAALSNLVGPLVADGVVHRERDPDDGRAVRLSLTPAGTDEIAATFRIQHEREIAWAGALSRQEQKTLIALLDKLVADRDDLGPRRRS